MATKKKTKKQLAEEAKTEAMMDEVEKEAKELIKKDETDGGLEFPPIILPPRGYFNEWDYGDSVRNLQLAMNRIMLANIPVTGEYDKETMAAVEEFEKKYGGCVNGKFGTTELIAYNKLRGAE